MEIILQATPRKGKLVFENAVDHDKYMEQFEGILLEVSMIPLAKLSEKAKMYRYLFGPLADSAMRGYIKRGYEGMDKVIAVYKLRAEFGKDHIYNSITKEWEPYLIELKKMNKERLLQFINECIHYIETNLEVEAPDSQQWKSIKIHGRKFTFREPPKPENNDGSN
jgi:hypothetical protein